VSVPVDDGWIRECAPVHGGLEDQWVWAAPRDPMIELAVDDELELLATVGAGGFDFDLEEAVAQVPLHEGRRDRVLRSGGVESFSGAEDEMVLGRFDSDRKRPRDVGAVSAHEEKAIALEIVHDVFDTLPGQPERIGDVADRDRPAESRQLSNDKVAHCMVLR